MRTSLLHKLIPSGLHHPTMRAVLAAMLALVVLAGTAAAGEQLYPACLMNWMVEGTFHALVVEKASQRLTVWRFKDGEPSAVASFRCSTGENQGDKWIRGDMKTPEGVYFFCSVIDGKTLPSKYGLWGFTTDYPNFVDRRRGKSGDGIWLHGRDKPLGVRPDSNGCIALDNEDLIRISKFIRLQSTPLIILDKVQMASRSQIMERERQVRDFIEGWRQAWESGDLTAYMDRYSVNFQSGWLDYEAWREKKRKLYQRYKKVRVKLGNVYLYRQDGLVTAIFAQEYTSDRYSSSGTKILYLVHGSSYRIYSEDYHRPVDDPFPVATLLAQAGGDPGVGSRENKEFSIRLVSTDEPEQRTVENLEAPQPTAPSRGVVLDRIIGQPPLLAPVIETNEKARDETWDRLLVARVMPTQADMGTVPILEGAPRLATRSGELAADARRKEESAPTRVAQSQPGVAPTPSPSEAADAQRKAETKSPEKSVANLASEGRDSAEVAKERELVGKFLAKWKRVWEQKDLDRFEKMYHPNFGGGNMNYDDFVKSKKRFFRKYRTIRVKVERVQIMKLGDKIIVKFLQSFKGDDYSDQGWKRMVLAGDKAQGLRILREEWSPL